MPRRSLQFPTQCHEQDCVLNVGQFRVQFMRQSGSVLDANQHYVPSKQKYSSEQRKLAVQYFLDHGRCIASTIKVLGYPCRKSLVAWIEELHPDVRKHIIGRAASPQYSPELKTAAVVELCTRQISAQAIAEKLAISRPTLYNWKNQLLGREAPPSMKCQHDSNPIPEKTEMQRQFESLQRDIRQLQLEHDILKKANELLKKDLGVDLQLLCNREKTLLVDALKPTYALSELLVELGHARSSYFYHRANLRKPEKYADERLAIAEVFETNHRCYGYRRMRAALRRQEVFISEKVIQRLMKQECLKVAANKKRRYGSYLGEISPAPENVINRNFKAVSPNQKWLTDITEFHIPAGKVYLSPIIDCFDGLVVSWTIGTRPDSALVNTMLDAAIETVTDCDERHIIHSDRGAHYRWPGWLSRMHSAKLPRSMSRKGCSPDNAACEGFFGRLKTELFYPRNWQATTIEQFVEVVGSYIHWYNDKRIKISLGSLSPTEYRERLGIEA